MYFNCKRIAVIVILMVSARIGIAQELAGDVKSEEQGIDVARQDLQTPAKDIEMIVQPNKCVALTQGRRCYAQVNITWQAEISVRVCLIEAKSLLRLDCWEGQRQGQYTYEMESAEDVILSLVPFEEVSVQNQIVLTSTTIEVSWLYEGSARKRRWRLF